MRQFPEVDPLPCWSRAARIYHPVAAVHLPCSFVTAYEGKLRVGNSPLLSSRLRRGSSHLEKASLPRRTPRIGSYSNRGASSALSYCCCFCSSFAAAATCCSLHKVPPELHPFSSSLSPGPTAAAPAAGTAGGAAPPPTPPTLQPPLKVCARAGAGIPCPPLGRSPVACPSAPGTQPLLMHLRLRLISAGLKADIGWGTERVSACVCLSVCARWACQSRLAGVEAERAAERRGAKRPSRGAAGPPAPGEARGSPAGCRADVQGEAAVAVATSRPRWVPPSGDTRRSPVSAPSAPGAGYRCGFGRSSGFPPLCVQLPVMLSPLSRFCMPFDR